jgi:small GTP-binding protein
MSPTVQPSASTTAPATAGSRAATGYVVLTGNPNCGKTTLFNALTGLRAKVANYPGVTVERKEGRMQGAPPDAPITILDLPGTYSLSPQSLDEQIARDVLFHRLDDVPPPELVVIVVDASNLQRNLYFATQVIELGYPTMIALNMIDVAKENGHSIDAQRLSAELGVPVVPTVASTGEGIAKLKTQIRSTVQTRKPSRPRQFCALPPAFATEADAIAGRLLKVFPETRFQSSAEALLILSDAKALASSHEHYPSEILSSINAARERLEKAGADWRSAVIEARYDRIAAIERTATQHISQRSAGPGIDTQSLGPADFPRANDADLSEHLLVCQTADEPHGRRYRLDRRSGGRSTAGRPAPGHARQRHYQWSGRGRGVPAPDLSSVLFHRFAGRHWLHGPRSVSHGPVDEQSGSARKEFHSHAQFIRVRDPGHHGHTHD